ncbi:hypothetical protein H2198_006044 [Neophaeococcomyces mojaviensis]|uniref:Uncharacterized protein n=1 Tax=Neophaeococcomyces mojaviensis TaxID=3383035 RepID=A0ACC3A3Z9_9EURO|nr:hypothetical protein H2198_006044 [Knufia sp. JES_112]
MSRPRAVDAPTAYAYKDLGNGEIRLLELDCKDQREHLTGTLRHWQTLCDPDKPSCAPFPSYTALSHHWDPKPEAEDVLPTLLLYDETEHKSYALPLRPSLHAALLAIRGRMKTEEWKRKTWTTHIWVDAICINQRSSSDKDKQLGKMGDIYNEAQAVIIWLGELDDDTLRGIKFIRSLQKLKLLQDFLTLERHIADWRCLVMLTRKPWFQRLWIVQEIAAARDAVVLVGDQSVSWDDFASALSILVSQFEQVRTMIGKTGYFARYRDPFGEVKLSAANVLVETRNRLLRKKADGDIAEHLKTLEALLTSLSMFEVTEQHDIVYAILWLSSDASQGVKKAYTRAHSYTMRTPRHEDNRNGHKRDSLAPYTYVSTSLPRRLSLSDQFLSVPATIAEQKQADERLKDTGIKINYEQTVFELCKQVLTHIIETTQRLDIICFHWAPQPRLHDLDATPPRHHDEVEHPSWLLYTQRNTYESSSKVTVSIQEPGDSVPALSETVRRVNADPLIGMPGSKRRPYLACGRTRAASAKIEGRTLHAYGYILNAIDVDAGVASDAIVPWKWRVELEWTDNNISPPDQFWRTLVADKGPDDEPPPPRFRLACKWAFELGPKPPATKRKSDGSCRHNPIGPNLNLEKIRNQGDGEAPLKEFLDCAIATVWNRKLFRTEQYQEHMGQAKSSFIGLGPEQLQRGDVVCILWGCAVPVVLRPAAKASQGLNVNGNHPAGEISPTPVINVVDEPSSHGTENALRPRQVSDKGKSRPNLNVRVIPDVHEDYTFVGECYVHGMMNGEIFNWAERNGRDVQDFRIH